MLILSLCVRFPELLENTNRQQHHSQHYNIHCGLFTESTGKPTETGVPNTAQHNLYDLHVATV